MSKINWSPSENAPIVDWGGKYMHRTFRARHNEVVIVKEEGRNDDGSFTIYYRQGSDETFTSLSKFLKTIK